MTTYHLKLTLKMSLAVQNSLCLQLSPSSSSYSFASSTSSSNLNHRHYGITHLQFPNIALYRSTRTPLQPTTTAIVRNASTVAGGGNGGSSRWSLSGQTALVTGGTRGIGRAIVEELVGLGARVHTCCRNGSELRQCLEEWDESRVSGSLCDVSVGENRVELIRAVSSVFDGKLNILVNNVGTNIRKPMEEFTLAEVSTLMSTNFESAFHLSQLSYPLLKASGQGSVVFTSSVTGFQSLKSMSVHGATKGAINQLTKSLACEWAKDNIRSNAVAPWYIKTSMVEQCSRLIAWLTRSTEMAKSEGKKQSTKKMEGKKKAPPLSKGKSAAESAVVRKRAAEKKKEKGVPTPTRSSSRIKGSSNPKTPATATPSKRKQDHRPEDSDSDFQNAVPVRRQKRTPREEAPISPDAPPIKAPSAVEKKDKIVQFRCKTGPIMDLNGKIVHHPRRNTIRRGLIDANFHGLLDIQVELINKELTQLLITSYEPDARRFVFPNGEVLTVQASDVGRVYGLVSTGERITVQSCPAVERRKLEASTGMRGNKYNIMHTNIKLAVLKTMIEECVDGNAFCRMYILHSLGTLLVPGNSWKITLNYAKYLNEDLSTLGTLNWGQYVVDTLLEGLDGLVTKASYPSGDFNFLVLHLLDMVRLDGLSAPKSPTCAFWDDGRVSEAVQMMKNSHGVWDFKLRRREQLKGLPLSEAPWLDELFETIPTQPTQDFATSSVRPVPTTFSGPTDGWAELVDVASADVGQLALMRQIAEAEVKYKRDELRGMEAHCRLWEARLTQTVCKDKAPSAGQGESSRQSRPLGETVVVPRPSPRTSEEMTSDSTSDSEDEVPNVGDIGKEAVAQAEKDIPENQPPRFVKAKSVQTPVFYDRPKTGSKTIGSPYVVEERVKKELTMDEHIIVKYVLRDDDRVYVLLVPSTNVCNVCYVCYMETDHVPRTE
ncbi:Tropinone reductase homolog At2g29260, chloroplastic, partial [Linum perenne]